MKKSKRFAELHAGFIDMLQRILDRGVAAGEFRPGVDAAQLHLTLAAVGYYYLTNRFTGEVIFGFDFVSKEALEARLRFNIENRAELAAPALTQPLPRSIAPPQWRRFLPCADPPR